MTYCPMCEGPDEDSIQWMGQLGMLVWFRCRGCGIEFPVHEDDLPDDEDDE